jgi:phage terminase large subunit-like protein
MVFSAPKKSGKTALAAMAALYVATIIGGPWAEIYALANDLDQATSRVFEACKRMVLASPFLKTSTKITANRIEFKSTGSFILACASDYAGFAGGNPSLTIFDELWAYISESARRLFDESAPSPTRKVSGRLTVSYAGYQAESDLLESIYKRAMLGERIAPDLYRNGSLLAYWTHDLHAPWQTSKWLEQQREGTRPNAFARMFRNEWVNAVSSFVAMEDWDGCTSQELRPTLFAPELPVWVGVDASVRHDATAIVAVTSDTNHVLRLVNHKVFRPSPDAPLDFEQTIIATLTEWMRAYRVRKILCDPWQLESIIQRLQKQGLPIEPYNQTSPGLTQMASNLFDLVRSRALLVYPDVQMRRSVLQTVASESGRGWKLSKEKQSHKIDVVVALAMACLAAARKLGFGPHRTVTFGSSPAEALFELFGKSGAARDEDIPSFDIGFAQRDGSPLPKPVDGSGDMQAQGWLK